MRLESRRAREERRRASCTGKLRHPKRAGAEKAAARQRREQGVGLEIYWCRFCRGWHLGGHEL